MFFGEMDCFAALGRAPAVRGVEVCRMHGIGGGAPRGNKNAVKHGAMVASRSPSKGRFKPLPGWRARRWQRLNRVVATKLHSRASDEDVRLYGFGRDMRAEPLERRRTLLRALLKGSTDNPLRQALRGRWAPGFTSTPASSASKASSRSAGTCRISPASQSGG
jgi:hypothetical protein